MAQTTHPYDVIIVGAGPVGASLALALAPSGCRVAVIEKQCFQDILDSKQDLRALALSEGTLRFLSFLNIEPKFQGYSEDILDIEIMNGDAGASLNFSSFDPGSQKNNRMGAIVEGHRLRHACIESLQELETVDLYDQVEIAELTNPSNGKAALTLSSGDLLSANLIVAADGHLSHVRGLTGIEPIVHDYNQQALITVVKHEKPHKGVAYEKFYPGGPFATLPMSDNRSGIVWIADPKESSFLKTCEKDFFMSLLRDRYEAVGELELVSDRTIYPLKLKFLETFYHNRVVFVGDAAHAIHPLAGQSLNLGFRDAAVLAEEIQTSFSLGMDLGSEALLSKYQQKRRFDTLELISVTHGLNRAFSANNPFLKLLTQVGLRVFKAIQGGARYTPRHAMGLTGHLSRFYR